MHENGSLFQQIDLLAGQTLIIPGAWIHAVYTPLDSLVFGGNYLHCYNIVRQLQVYVIELRTHVGKAYRFPHFKSVNWFVLCSLLPIAKKRLSKSYLNSLIASKKGSNDTVQSKLVDESDDDEDEDLISMCDSLRNEKV